MSERKKILLFMMGELFFLARVYSSQCARAMSNHRDIGLIVFISGAIIMSVEIMAIARIHKARHKSVRNWSFKLNQ
jgi:hypothetical protein